MNDLRSPLEDRPYRPATRSLQDDRVISTPEYYRSKFDALRQSRWFPLASVAAAVIVFGGIISYAYDQGSQSGTNATTPIVQASNEDYKEKPANPGGMDVPFQDAVVFDQLGANTQQTASAQTVESLLPDAEKPVDTTTTASTATDAKDAAKATKDQQTAAAATNAKETTLQQNAADITAATAETNTNATTTATTTTPSEKLTTASTAQSTAKSTDEIAKKMDEVAPASAPATTKIQSGTYKIQLGAFRDETAAKAAWTKFQKEFNSQLSGVTPAFTKADLGAKGTFYRVQGVNLSKATADELCRSINSAKSGSCIVAR